MSPHAIISDLQTVGSRTMPVETHEKSNGLNPALSDSFAVHQCGWNSAHTNLKPWLSYTEIVIRQSIRRCSFLTWRRAVTNWGGNSILMVYSVFKPHV